MWLPVAKAWMGDKKLCRKNLSRHDKQIRSYTIQGKLGGIWAGCARPNTPTSYQLRKSRKYHFSTSGMYTGRVSSAPISGTPPLARAWWSISQVIKVLAPLSRAAELGNKW
jgi:hypothetical protein